MKTEEAKQLRDEFLAISRNFHQGRLTQFEFEKQVDTIILQSFEKICREAFKEGGKFADYCTVLGADGNLDIASEDYWKSLTENKQP